MIVKEYSINNKAKAAYIATENVDDKYLVNLLKEKFNVTDELINNINLQKDMKNDDGDAITIEEMEEMDDETFNINLLIHRDDEFGEIAVNGYNDGKFSESKRDIIKNVYSSKDNYNACLGPNNKTDHSQFSNKAGVVEKNVYKPKVVKEMTDIKKKEFVDLTGLDYNKLSLLYKKDDHLAMDSIFKRLKGHSNVVFMFRYHQMKFGIYIKEEITDKTNGDGSFLFSFNLNQKFVVKPNYYPIYLYTDKWLVFGSSKEEPSLFDISIETDQQYFKTGNGFDIGEKTCEDVYGVEKYTPIEFDTFEIFELTLQEVKTSETKTSEVKTPEIKTSE